MQSVSAIFPLTGLMADISVGLEFVISFFTIQIFVYFLLKYLKSPKKKKIRASRNLAWAVLCLGVGFTYIVFIIGDFILEPGLREEFNSHGYLILCISAFIFLMITERLENSKYHIFTIVISLTLIILIISIILEAWTLAFSLATVGFPVALMYFIYYTRKLLHLSNRSERVVSKIRVLFIALVLILLGYTSMADALVSTFGLGIRIAGDCATIIGLSLFLYTIHRLPDFTEFDWIDGLESILVVNESGVSLFGRFYGRQRADGHGKHMISGALSTVKAVLEEMTGRKRMKTVYLDDKVLHFEYRMNVTFAVIMNKYYESVAIRLEQFADEFETIFKEVVDGWNGNLRAFFPAEAIVDRIFVSKYQKKSDSSDPGDLPVEKRIKN